MFFHLIKNQNIIENLYSHIKIDNISSYPNEKEILFLPFSCFEIVKINPEYEKLKAIKSISNNKKVEYYIIELTYFGKYEKDLRLIENEETIPCNKFKQSLENSKFIDIITNFYK